MARFDFKLVVLSSLCLTAHSAPAPLPNPVAQGQVHDYATYKSDFAAFPTASPTTIPFTGSSGSLRGSDALNGYNPSNPIKDESTVIPPSDFELAPGQSEEASLGLFLDFDGVENFQPIRGSTSNPTDPGPRMSSTLIINRHQLTVRRHRSLRAPEQRSVCTTSYRHGCSSECKMASWPFSQPSWQHGNGGVGPSAKCE